MSYISAIILAAGQSKRMGQPKLLLEWFGRTILEQTIDTYLASAVSETIVVLGFEVEKMLAAIGERPVQIVINPDYRQGMSTSIIVGLGATNPKASAYLLALADQPDISHHITDKLVQAFERGVKGIVVPVFQGKRGNPVVFSSKYRDELLAIQGDIGGREIISRHRNDVLEIKITNEAILKDIDTPVDYEIQKNKIQCTGK